MLPVRITVTINARALPIEKVSDPRVASAFRTAGEDVGRRLASILCPEHGKTATNVRVHFDARGNADLQYDSCCEKLGQRIGEALG